jgi:two-component sensor histidine kinase
MATTAGASAHNLPSILQDFVERIPTGVTIKDSQLRYIYANQDSRARIDAGSWIGKTALEVHPLELGEKLRETDERALAGDHIESEVECRGVAGETIWFRVTKFPMLMPDGDYVVCSMLDDVTPLVKAKAELAAALEAKDALLKEVYHRVKNNLTTVASLLSLESASIEDERALKSFEECQARIQSMALVHEELYGSKDLSRLDFGPYVSKIARRISYSFGQPSDVELAIECESVPLEAETAVPLGLVANELITNAFKYAFAAGRGGRLAVRLSRHPPDEAVLSIADDGSGLAEGIDPETTTSLGFQLVRSLARQVEGHAEFFREGGFECRVFFPARMG